MAVYCREMATLATSAGSMRWSWSSSPRSIWTTSIWPLNRLGAGVVGADRHAVVVADVGRLVGGEDHRLRRARPDRCRRLRPS